MIIAGTRRARIERAAERVGDEGLKAPLDDDAVHGTASGELTPNLEAAAPAI